MRVAVIFLPEETISSACEMMKTSVIIACLSLCSLASGGCYESIGREINELSVEVANFDNLVRSAIATGKEKYTRAVELSHKIDKIKGSGCDDEYEFQCGGMVPQCLSRLLVCDGHEDCANGADESRCDGLMPAGSKWRGDFIYKHCMGRNTDHFELTVTEYETNDVYLPVGKISAELHLKSEEENFSYASNVPLHGVLKIVPGDQTVLLRPLTKPGLLAKCTFHKMDDSHCHGEIQYINSRTTCAEFVLTRTD